MFVYYSLFNYYTPFNVCTLAGLVFSQPRCCCPNFLMMLLSLHHVGLLLQNLLLVLLQLLAMLEIYIMDQVVDRLWHLIGDASFIH